MSEVLKLEKKYPRVVKQLSKRIDSGIYTEAIPGVKQLAKEFDVNFMTVNKAIKMLEEQGLVYRIPRKGTYVKRMRNIAFCFEYIYQDFTNYSVFSPLYLSTQRYLSHNNCPMFIESSMSLKNKSLDMIKNRIDGLIFSHNSPEKYFTGQPIDIPVVRVLSEFDDCPYDHITYNNESIGRLVGEFMLQNGHREVAFIGDQKSLMFRRRLITFQETMIADGGKVILSPYDEDSWEPRFQNINKQVTDLFSKKNYPKALFCPSDNEIGMIYSSLNQLQIRPMVDVLIVSCNNDRRILELCAPPPVSVDIQMIEIGKLAAQRLLERIDNPKLKKRQDLLEPVVINFN